MNKYIRSTRKLVKISVTGFVIIIFLFGLLSFSESRDFKLVKNMEVFSNLFRELTFYYVDEPDPEELIKTGINAMLKTLDPYTVYISEKDMNNFKFTTTGNYGGVGSLIRKKDDYILITNVYKGFPADKAGIRAGDLIIKVDETSIKGKSSNEVSDLLKGSPGSKVKISVKRFGHKDPLSFVLERKEINISNIPYYGMLNEETGYIRLSNFRTDAAREMNAALNDLKKNYGASSLIIDLRGNPGGLLMEAVDICNLFVVKGEEIVKTKGKVKEYEYSYIAEKQAVDKEIPLVIMVDRGSASASEIVAGAMQDLDRAIILGERTYGKGLVQTTRPLGYNNQLKVTTAKYYIPSGRCIQAVDYSNRNKDGSVGHIPDSLISEFKTKNGRTVYDGGGILPDIITKQEEPGLITYNLFAKDIFFDFATKYSYEKPEIALPQEYEFSEDDFQLFMDYVFECDFDYESRACNEYKSLVEIVKQDKLYDDNEELFLQLKEILQHDIKTELQNHREEINRFLSSEIVGRYYYQAGSIEKSLASDRDVEEAIKILSDKDTYDSLLMLSLRKEKIAPGTN